MRFILTFFIINIFCYLHLNAQIEPTDTDGNGYRNVSTLEHLRWISENDSSWSWNFELDNDIDASDTRNWNVGDHDNDTNTPDSAMGFKPIGIYNLNNPNPDKGYTGSFYGKSKKIKNLYINRASENYIGFFGSISNNGNVRNLIIQNSEVHGQSHVGIFCGIIFEHEYNVIVKITKCTCTGVVYGCSYVGGFIGSITSDRPDNEASNMYIYQCGVNVNIAKPKICSIESKNFGGFCGYNNGEINSCYSYGMVDSWSYVGGFCGKNNSGKISDCYAINDVRGRIEYIAGFCGTYEPPKFYRSIRNCYFAGHISGAEVVGGFCSWARYNSMDSILFCYWDKEVSGMSSSKGGEGKTTTEMKTQSTFVNWDFDNIWAIDPNINDGYPYLRGTPIVSVEEKRNKTTNDMISIYPNPSSDFLNIESQINIPISKIEIYNLLGEKVLSYENNHSENFKLNISELQNGTYFVRVFLNNEIAIKNLMVYR